MPATSGVSHGLAAFTTLLVGTVLSKWIWDLLPPLGEAALATVSLIRATTGVALPADERFAGTVVVMVALSFVWGVVYHFGRHD
jgi:hypothetical protein